MDGFLLRRAGLKEETYVKTRATLLRNHIVAPALTVLVAPADLVPWILRFLAGLDEVVVGNICLRRASRRVPWLAQSHVSQDGELALSETENG